MAQVDQGEQHLLVRMKFAASASSGAALSSGLRLLFPVAPGDEFGQGSRQELSERSGFEAEESANPVFRKGVQLLKVHATVIGQRQHLLYFTEQLIYNNRKEMI